MQTQRCGPNLFWNIQNSSNDVGPMYHVFVSTCVSILPCFRVSSFLSFCFSLDPCICPLDKWVVYTFSKHITAVQHGRLMLCWIALLTSPQTRKTCFVCFVINLETPSRQWKVLSIDCGYSFHMLNLSAHSSCKIGVEWRWRFSSNVCDIPHRGSFW